MRRRKIKSTTDPRAIRSYLTKYFNPESLNRNRGFGGRYSHVFCRFSSSCAFAIQLACFYWCCYFFFFHLGVTRTSQTWIDRSSTSWPLAENSISARSYRRNDTSHVASKKKRDTVYITIVRGKKKRRKRRPRPT